MFADLLDAHSRLALDYTLQAASDQWQDGEQQQQAPRSFRASPSDRSVASSESDGEAPMAKEPSEEVGSFSGPRQRLVQCFLSGASSAALAAVGSACSPGHWLEDTSFDTANGRPAWMQGAVTADMDPLLLEDGVNIRGLLLHVKGWWRKGPRLAERFVEIRRSSSGREQQLVWCRVGKDGVPDLSKLRRIEDLSGSAVETVELQQHPGLHTFRVYALPQLREEPLDFAAPTAEARTRWLEAFAKASEQKPEVGIPRCGTLQLSVSEVCLQLREQPAIRRQLWTPPDTFAVVRCSGMGCRTVARRLQANAGDGAGVASFTGHAVEFPVIDDDPDSLVTLEVWTSEGRRRHRLHGRVDVPLYCFGRNCSRELNLTLRDVTRLRGEGNEVGTISLRSHFEQPLESLLLPRQPRRRAGPVKNLGEQTLRKELEEFEAFLRDFEVFSSRFMHHCDTWRDVSFMLRRVVQWDSPMATFACLIALTLQIGFFPHYALPVAIFLLLCVTVWYHPWCRQCRTRAPQWRATTRARQLHRRFHAAGQRWSWPSCVRLRFPYSLPFKAVCQTIHEHASPSVQTDDSADGSGAESVPRVKERFENERRLVLGKFTAQRLRFYDPPAWSDADGGKAEPPRSVEDNVQYVWTVEVNRFTDSDGWRYSRRFGRNAVWSRAFQHQMFVRRRRHIGRPVLAPGTTAAMSSGASASGSRCAPGSPQASRSASPTKAAPREHAEVNPEAFIRNATTAEGGKGPQFGIAKTPFHDMYQQYLLRWAFLRRQIEYWMDWYERRKNLFLGVTVSTQNFAVLGVLLLLVAACAIPTRWLALGWIYSFFYDGLAQGRLMRRNQNIFMRALKDNAVTVWLESEEARARASSWGLSTTLEEVTDTGVQLLELRDWIRTEFFEGRPMVPLRAVHRCGTLGELAVQITWTSDYFVQRRPRPRIWYRSTFRNLLDHVPSDATLFQPLTCQGLGGASY